MHSKIARNRKLRELLPHGYLTTRKALLHADFTSHQIDNLLKSEAVIAVAPGVYCSPGVRLTWEGVIASLQRLGFDVSVGGQTALAIAGQQHYLPLSGKQPLMVFSSSDLPSWVGTVLPDEQFIFLRHARLLDASASDGPLWSDSATSRQPEFRFKTSLLELAWLEALLGVPKALSFEHADFLMQGLTTLSPKRLNFALSHCVNIKVKRLFFWFARRHQHAWVKRLDHHDYDLGTGKRMVAKPGRLDKTFLITVPEEMYGSER